MTIEESAAVSPNSAFGRVVWYFVLMVAIVLLSSLPAFIVQKYLVEPVLYWFTELSQPYEAEGDGWYDDFVLFHSSRLENLSGDSDLFIYGCKPFKVEELHSQALYEAVRLDPEDIDRRRGPFNCDAKFGITIDDFPTGSYRRYYGENATRAYVEGGSFSVSTTPWYFEKEALAERLASAIFTFVVTIIVQFISTYVAVASLYTSFVKELSVWKESRKRKAEQSAETSK